VLKSDSAKLSTSQPVLDSCKPTNACEEFKRKRKETTCQPCNEDGTAPGGSGGGDEECECRMKDLRLKCLLGALAALLAGGLVCFQPMIQANPL